MQIVSTGDKLHEMSNPVFRKNEKNIINVSSAEITQRVAKVKGARSLLTFLKASIIAFG